MAVLMSERQIVDSVVREAGELVSSDATTESYLVAHGKATEVTEQPSLPIADVVDVTTSKGGKA